MSFASTRTVSTFPMTSDPTSTVVTAWSVPVAVTVTRTSESLASVSS